MSKEELFALTDSFMKDEYLKVIETLKPGSEGTSLGEKIYDLCGAFFMVGVSAGIAYSQRVEA